MLNNINSIFLDFDGTITKSDTVNSFFKTFAAPEWINIEKDWVEGKINSKTCMQMQLDLIKNLTEEKFFNFLDLIEIQDGFAEFCRFAKENNKKITVISDGFDFFINYILKKEKLDIDFYSNHLQISKENGFLKFKLSFPNLNNSCTQGLGTCKCSVVQKSITKNELFIYAGDGLSDRCIASKANLLFAKNSLKKHCLKNNIEFVDFENFFQISRHLFKEGTTENARVEAKGEAFRG